MCQLSEAAHQGYHKFKNLLFFGFFLRTCPRLKCPDGNASELQVTTQWSFTPVSFGSCVCVWNMNAASFCLVNKPESVCETWSTECGGFSFYCLVSISQWVYSIFGGEMNLPSCCHLLVETHLNMYLNTHCCLSCLTELVVWEIIRLDKEHIRKAVSRGLKQLHLQCADSIHHNILWI